ncbi:hypothetical protein JOB18_027829 [Solea senegalensis]|uniref:Uncharacterized protein n=1 Tax=Solea senegalensis TaxID=28829 RepID=A0AAV6RT61_SOLSE|nr:hypothetical protein JOB18_027829 [Solea senegalensis]
MQTDKLRNVCEREIKSKCSYKVIADSCTLPAPGTSPIVCPLVVWTENKESNTEVLERAHSTCYAEFAPPQMATGWTPVDSPELSTGSRPTGRPHPAPQGSVVTEDSDQFLTRRPPYTLFRTGATSME